MSKVLFVVHRYYPYPGGSENYVRWMAEEMKDRGHDVTVYATDNQGDQNGIKVRGNANVMYTEKFDLIVVHGADVHAQNTALMQALELESPVMYMIILPSESETALLGLKYAKYLAWSTEEDYNHIVKYGQVAKARNVRHGIKFENFPLPKREEVCQKYGINPNKKIILSCGGYWPNKKMKELAEFFEQLRLSNAVLVTTGYGGYYDLMPHKSDLVFPLVMEEFEEVQKFMSIADLYVMHSDREGFGLVLLEASMRGLPWAARHMAGAAKLVHANGEGKPLGFTYKTDAELANYLFGFCGYDNGTGRMPPVVPDLNAQAQRARAYVEKNHLIGDTCDDIEAVLKNG